MDGSLDFKALRESLQAALVATTRTANSIASEDLQFQRTVNPTVGGQLDNSSGRLLSLANGLLKSTANLTGQKVGALEDADDVDIQWRNIVDVIDSLLEKADTCLDEYTGLIKRKDAPTPADQGRAQKRVKSSNDRLDWSLKRANILKPQNNFERKVDNFATGPWKPLLSSKPHAKVSLEDSLTTFVDDDNNTQYVYLSFPKLQEHVANMNVSDTSIPTKPRSRRHRILSMCTRSVNPRSTFLSIRHPPSGLILMRASWRCWRSSSRPRKLRLTWSIMISGLTPDCYRSCRSVPERRIG